MAAQRAITDELIAEWERLLADGWTYRQLAKRYSMHKERIRAIIRRRRRGAHTETPQTADRELTEQEVSAKVAAAIETEKYQAQIRNWRRQYDEAKKRAAFVERACEMLRDIVVALPDVHWDSPAPAIHVAREMVPTLVICDAHVGDEYKPELMGALGAYNFAIFQQKVRRLYAGILDALKYYSDHGQIRRMQVLFLGDVVTGTNIFPGQAHHIEFGAMEQAIKGADEFAHFLRELLHLPGIERLDIECVPGNHGRPGRKGQDPFEDNWDNVLYEFMRLRLGGIDRIRFKWHTQWWMLVDILGWQFLCAHGDEIRGWQQIPNYGFRRWEQNWRKMLDRIGLRFDYSIVGHHHIDVEEESRMIGGAWPGASFFGAKALGSLGAESQLMFGVVEDYGVSWRYRVPLYEPRRPGQKPLDGEDPPDGHPAA